MVMRPQQFDVVLTPNLYGAILQNIASGLVGGPGIVPGANVGTRGHAVFESVSNSINFYLLSISFTNILQGARHVGFDISGKNIADPIGSLLTSVMMLRHLDLNEHATRIENAVYETVREKQVRTQDIGGTSTTRQFTKAVIDNLA